MEPWSLLCCCWIGWLAAWRLLLDVGVLLLKIVSDSPFEDRKEYRRSSVEACGENALVFCGLVRAAYYVILLGRAGRHVSVVERRRSACFALHVRV